MSIDCYSFMAAAGSNFLSHHLNIIKLYYEFNLPPPFNSLKVLKVVYLHAAYVRHTHKWMFTFILTVSYVSYYYP